MNSFNSFNSFINKNLGWVHKNNYILPVISLVLGMYAALARPKLPKFVEKLFENPISRLLMISYIIYLGNQDPQLSIMIAAAFLITIHMINKRQVKNMAKKIEKMAAPKAPAPPAPAPAPAPKPPAPPAPKPPAPPAPKPPAPAPAPPAPAPAPPAQKSKPPAQIVKPVLAASANRSSR